MDELGRVVLPVDMRKKLKLTENVLVDIKLENDKIVLTKAKPDCVICHSVENKLVAIENNLICSACIKNIKLNF